MQLNGIGHSSDMHHVTNCMHDHSHYDKSGKMGASASMGAQALEAAKNQADAQLSLSAWLEKTLSSGKRLWKGIWGSSDAGAAGQPGERSGAEQLLAQIYDINAAENQGSHSAGADSILPDEPQAAQHSLRTPQIAAAATAVQLQDLQNNPYFSAVDREAEQQGSLWRRMRVKLKDMTGRLAGHLPGKFFGAQTKSSFQAKQQRPKEDLRKRSTFRKDEVEINCMLTDDSYLLDSYDKKGEYRKL